MGSPIFGGAKHQCLPGDEPPGPPGGLECFVQIGCQSRNGFDWRTPRYLDRRGRPRYPIPSFGQIRLPSPYNRRRQKALEALHQLITGIIEKRRKDPQSYDDLLDMLLKARDEETGEGMDDQQLKDEVMTILWPATKQRPMP
ncbi:MAG: cytochrome P450 [Microscillaceae bacterium]|nr:cytochrome P450 [Microscillaceae bacterium]